MKRDINRFGRSMYDVLIVGGGINGAALANMAALNGLKVALLEKGDFASGTSSKSTKLLHGGIRYLEHFEFGLVKESLRERYIQLKNAPHLIKPLPFIIPVYKNDKRPLWMIRLGVLLYDLLSGEYAVGMHRDLNVGDLLKLEPGIKTEGLLGGVLYYDAQMDDTRLCLENVLMADQRGAHVANYVEVTEVLKKEGKVVGVKACDLVKHTSFEVRAKKVVSATGPWTNHFLRLDTRKGRKKIRTTKGVHIVYRGQLSKHALLVPTQEDKRIVFVIPWRGNSLIGTTDTNYIRHPDYVEASQKDIDYLFKECKRIFPKTEFKEENIITTFAGLRPLIRRAGSPSKVSRKHTIGKTSSGLIYVIGGKYTTYRKIAEDCMRFLTRKKLVQTRKKYPLYGSGMIKEKPERAAKKYGIGKDIIQYLMDLYGIRYRDVLALTQTDVSLKERICSCFLGIKAQIVYCIQTEMACKEEDIIQRRLSLGYHDCKTGECRKVIHRSVLGLADA